MNVPLDILVIDDDSVDRMLITRQLQQLPNSVIIHEATTAAEGLELIRAKSIDCVLLDYHLPDQDGVEFLGRYGAETSRAAPAVIMMTGEGNEMVAVAAMKAGAHDYLIKAERDPAELWSVIEAALCATRVGQEDAKKKLQMEKMALTDSVTLIGSRNFFDLRLAHALDRVRREGANIALLLMDLDGFKKINDSLGHQAGDKVLREVARRVQSEIRVSDTVARLGGDEFVVIMETGVTSEGARYLADRIHDKVIQPVCVAHQDVFVGISIGIALYPHNGESPEALLNFADTEMYSKKTRVGHSL